jgi:DnaJ-like protein
MPAMPQTHYEILGVSKDANTAEIDTAYRTRAKDLHPDMPRGDADKFKRLNEAHSVLGDSYKRRLYDLQTQLPAQRERQPASSAGVWINILLSLGFGAMGVLFWLKGDKPGDEYNGYFVALGWLSIFYGIGVFVDREYKFSNPLTIAARVGIYLLHALIGILLSLSVLGALALALAGIASFACLLYSLVF